MKKYLLTSMLIVGLLVFTACGKDKAVDQGENPSKGNINNISMVEETQNGEGEENTSEDQEKLEDKEAKEKQGDKKDLKSSSSTISLLKNGYEGKIDGIEFGIGSVGKDIVAGWGEADEEDFFLGGLYLKYGDITFMTDGYDHDGEVVNIILAKPKENVFGVKIGMTFEEIENILGKASAINSPDTQENDELYGDSWTMVYDLNEYELVFAAGGAEKATDWLSLHKKK